MRLILRTDGAARGNPGPSAAGVVIEELVEELTEELTEGLTEGLVEERDGGRKWRALARLGRLLGRGTNNEAEYRAAIIALEEAAKLGAEEVEVRTDSQLLARQLLGRYKVRAANLKPLHRKAVALLGSFRRSDIRHVPREENREADRLANLALDGQADVDERVD